MNYNHKCQLTVTTHFGIISLLSYTAVLLSFLDRYSSSVHNPTSLSSRQNSLYNLYLFSSLAGCGLQWPRRKSGGFWMTHGAHKQCGQWSSPRRSGHWGLFLYPFGWLGWLSNNYTSPALIMCRHKKVYSPCYLAALVPVLALDPTPHLLYYRVVGCPERRHSPWIHSFQEILGCV